MSVREMSERTGFGASARIPSGPPVQPDPAGDGSGRVFRNAGSDATSTALPPSLKTKFYDVEPESENFDEWLAWLDETCALARRMGIERQIEWHVGQLAELSLRWIEEGTEA